MKDELEDLVISAEFALHQIQTLHDDVTGNLAFEKGSQTKIDDFQDSVSFRYPCSKVEPAKMCL